MHLNVHDEVELRVDKTPVLTSRWLVVHYGQMAILLMFRTCAAIGSRKESPAEAGQVTCPDFSNHG